MEPTAPDYTVRYIALVALLVTVVLMTLFYGR